MGKRRSLCPAHFVFNREKIPLKRVGSRYTAFWRLVGESGFEPLKLNSDRFTVCSLWPLGNSPINMELVNGLEPLTC